MAARPARPAEDGKSSDSLAWHAHDSVIDHHSATAEPHPAAAEEPSRAHTVATPDDDREEATAYESDSGFDSGSLLGDDTDTLASSVIAGRIENGRQYHAYRDGAYWGPNDELAKEILDFAHHMYLITLDQRLHLAPLKNPQRILDVGCGTGIWAIDIAGTSPLHPVSLPCSYTA